ncbi:acyl-CoA dehydrogenase family protein [soil metagenome]
MATVKANSFGPVSLAPGRSSGVGPLTALAFEREPKDVETALAVALELGSWGRHPGGGSTRDLWEALATIGSIDLGAARTVEPHLDALAILSQAGGATTVGHLYSTTQSWGVFAAEGAGLRVTAVRDGSRWRLDGVKPWCSLAGVLDAALVTAFVGPDERQLFAVELGQPGITVEPGAWHARGLTEIPSGPVHFDGVSAVAVGDAGWYLERPGFHWGGMGVAACWFGGMVGLARTLFTSAVTMASSGRKPDDLFRWQLGAVDIRIESARRALSEAAASVDSGEATGKAGRLLAKRVRATVAGDAERVIELVGHALGPAPLALDEEHAKRVADLQLYLRQDHAERDVASLGSALLEGTVTPW